MHVLKMIAGSFVPINMRRAKYILQGEREVVSYQSQVSNRGFESVLVSIYWKRPCEGFP